MSKSLLDEEIEIPDISISDDEAVATPKPAVASFIKKTEVLSKENTTLKKKPLPVFSSTFLSRVPGEQSKIAMSKPSDISILTASHFNGITPLANTTKIDIHTKTSTITPPRQSSIKVSTEESEYKAVSRSKPQIQLKKPSLSFGILERTPQPLHKKSLDPCLNYNYFEWDEMSCYIDSLLFALLHKRQNGFVEQLLHLKTLPDNSHNGCMTKVIDEILKIYDFIHNDTTELISRMLCTTLRRILYDCSNMRTIGEHFFMGSQNDVNEFFNIIYDILDIPKNKHDKSIVFDEVSLYFDSKKIKTIQNYSKPHSESNPVLVESFLEYPTHRNDKMNPLILFNVLDGETEININIVQQEDGFMIQHNPTPISFNRATKDYPDIIDFIRTHNLIDMEIKKQMDSDSIIKLDEFLKGLDPKKQSTLYDELYKKYSSLLPKLNYTVSQITEIYEAPLDFLLIGIQREFHTGQFTDEGIPIYSKNNFPVRGLPDRITTNGGKVLELVSAITHSGSLGRGHYICYFKCGDNWYIMNDMTDQLTKYKRFDVNDTAIMREARLFVYM